MQLSFHLHRSDAPHEVRLFYSSLQHVGFPALAVLLQEQTEKQLRIAAVLGLSGFCRDSTETHLHRGRLQGRAVPARVPACSPALGKEEVCDGARLLSEVKPCLYAGLGRGAAPGPAAGELFNACALPTANGGVLRSGDPASKRRRSAHGSHPTSPLSAAVTVGSAQSPWGCL
ncbi:uncharacterized protein LOC124418007 isoform X2 [Gallus gallus]|uniref:uncharacterized protein LOC124418007 isoform X2 n=1 Tax=Gallus gallus TaxID=9031 RepID=UPI001F01BCF2|nr:uncharacterized protein LOC124418007 isoform X2 [Gallus gallus]